MRHFQWAMFMWSVALTFQKPARFCQKSNKMMKFKRKLWVQNIPSLETLFSIAQLKVLAEFLKRKDKSKAPKAELAKVNRMFEVLELYTLIAMGVDEFGHIRWGTAAEQKEGSHEKTDLDPRGVGELGYVIRCKNSRCCKLLRISKFQEEPLPTLCQECQIRIEASEKVKNATRKVGHRQTPAVAKQEDIPF